MSKLKLSRKTRISDIDHVFEEARHAVNGCINRHPGSVEILKAKLADVLWRAEDLMNNK
jgi:hypothetical protein